MKAEVIKARGMSGEYFAIKLHGIELNSELLGDMAVILQLPAHHYDWMVDPEAVISEIANRINSGEKK